MNPYVTMLQEAMETHEREIEELKKKRKPLEGIFGFGNSSAIDACHDRFDRRVEEILSQQKRDNADSNNVNETVSYMMEAVKPSDDLRGSALNRIAALRHCFLIVDYLSHDDAFSLVSSYEKTWPGRARLPVQNELLKRLKSR